MMRDSEKEYIDKLKRLQRDGVLRALRYRQWVVGGGFCLVLLGMGAYGLRKYLQWPEGSLDNIHFLCGIVLCLFCIPSILLLGFIFGQILEGIAESEERPYTLLTKYYEKLIDHGIDPEGKP